MSISNINNRDSKLHHFKVLRHISLNLSEVKVSKYFQMAKVDLIKTIVHIYLFFAFSISSLLIIGCQNQSSLISLTILLIRHCNTSRFMSRLQIIQGLYNWTVKQSDIYVLSTSLWKWEIFEHRNLESKKCFIIFIKILSKIKLWMPKA